MRLMRNRHNSLLPVALVLSFLLAPSALLAHQAPPLACEPTARTLVEGRSTEHVNFNGGIATSSAYVLCDDGRYAGARWFDSLEVGTFVIVFRGQLRPEDLADIYRAMLAARIGFATDCEVDLSEGGAPRPGEYDVAHLVTWYGRGTRHRTFVASWPAPERPVCSPEIEAVLKLIKRLGGGSADRVVIDGVPTL